jgi:hypothetical protein
MACPAMPPQSLPKGSRLFRRLDPERFLAAFQRFMTGFSKTTPSRSSTPVIAASSHPRPRSRRCRVAGERPSMARPGGDRQSGAYPGNRRQNNILDRLRPPWRAPSPERFNKVVRSHWGVENRPHWRLDAVMNEDQDRSRLKNGPHNLAVLRNMALNGMAKGLYEANSKEQIGMRPTSPGY